MKRTILATIIVAFAAVSAIAQQKNKVAPRNYFRVGAGYAFAHAGNTPMAQMPAGFQSNYLNVTRIEYKRGSFGQGFYASLAFGHWFNDHLGGELGVSVGVRGRRFDYRSEGTEVVTLASYAEMPVYLMPAAILQTGGRVNVYARVGIAVNLSGKIVEDGSWTSFGTGGTTVAEARTLYKFRTGVGFQGALGIEKSVSKRISLYLEANGISMNQYLKKSTVTRYSENQVDVMYRVPVYYKETEYEMNYSEGLPMADEPRKAASYALPFSNFGAAAGIIVKF